MVRSTQKGVAAELGVGRVAWTRALRVGVCILRGTDRGVRMGAACADVFVVEGTARTVGDGTPGNGKSLVSNGVPGN